MGGGPRGTRINYARLTTQNNNLFNYEKDSHTKRNVFISFHMEDEAQIGLLRHQAKNDKFNLKFTDYSVKTPFNSNWKARCEERIKQSSITVVMIGADTYKRPAVLWEINKSYELGKKVIGIRIHKDGNDPIPGPLLRNKAKIINWSMEGIQDELDKK